MIPMRTAAPLAAALLLAGCAGLPPERGYADAGALVRARIGTAPDPATWATPEPAPVPAAPLTAEQAIALAFVHNPRIREQYARLGIARAELEDARRIANPTFGYARTHGAQPAIVRSLSIGFADLLMLPARKRHAAGELERIQHAVAAELLSLATDVERAWYAAAGARQVAEMRALTAGAAEQSAALAQRFFDAGNIDRLQLERERAEATRARIDAVRAMADALQSRSELAALTGLSTRDDWEVLARLPAPAATEYDVDRLVALALEQRLDLAAAHGAVALREDLLGVTRRWRWLGTVELGFEREREPDGVSQGPSLAIELPLFGIGQGATARAQAELVAARAELDALALGVANDARLAVQRIDTARDIAERYRAALLPAQEAIVARMQERVNYMLVGVFELIAARREEYDAYQAYLEAVRDYWIARAELRRVVGGRLPGDGDAAAPALGVDAMMPAAPAAHDHGAHADPHHGHSMPERSEPDDAAHDHGDHR